MITPAKRNGNPEKHSILLPLHREWVSDRSSPAIFDLGIKILYLQIIVLRLILHSLEAFRFTVPGAENTGHPL
jgi:hypothetical protein